MCIPISHLILCAMKRSVETQAYLYLYVSHRVSTRILTQFTVLIEINELLGIIELTDDPTNQNRNICR